MPHGGEPRGIRSMSIRGGVNPELVWVTRIARVRRSVRRRFWFENRNILKVVQTILDLWAGSVSKSCGRAEIRLVRQESRETSNEWRTQENACGHGRNGAHAGRMRLVSGL